MNAQTHLIEEEILRRKKTAAIARREGVSERMARKWKEPPDDGNTHSGRPGRLEAANRYLSNVEAEHPFGADLGAEYIYEAQTQRRLARTLTGRLSWAEARRDFAAAMGAAVDALLGEKRTEEIEMAVLRLQAYASRVLFTLGLRGEAVPVERQLKG